MSEARIFSSAGVAAPHPAAAVAARDVLIEGGNAIEAAVAAAAVAAVVLPGRAGLAADGLWLIREAGSRGRTRVIDARGPACGAATLSRYRQNEAERVPSLGAEAVLTVPAAIAGWQAALDLSAVLGGRLPVSRLLEAAVLLARQGAPVSPAHLDDAALVALAEVPGFAKTFLDEGRWPEAGTIRSSPALAQTLAYLAHAGLDDFQRGDVGREMAVDLEQIGSPLGRADLRHVEARWREPVSLDIGRQTLETPPTGQGFAFLLGLAIFDRLPRPALESAAHWHGLIEAQARAEALIVEASDEGRDPATLFGSPLLERETEAIARRRASTATSPMLEGEDGIWIGTVDAEGLAVTLVQSMGRAFGSGVVLPRTGLLMNARGAAFALSSDVGPVLRPGRRAPFGGLPLIAASRDGGFWVSGMTGAGARLLAAQITTRMTLGMSPAEAVAAPRLVAAPDPDGTTALFVEEGFDEGLARDLRRAGHPLLREPADGFGEGGIVLRHAKGQIEIAADSRREGAAEGV